jgi:nucleoside 2-deoxyribosyltransferase
MTTITAFVAYPAGSNLVVDAIRAAVGHVRARPNPVSLDTWEEVDIPGRFIASEILQRIEECDVLVADVSRLNFNVAYEVGYGIGKGKRILLIKHRAVQEQSPTIQEVGIFDTLGYREYSAADELATFLANVRDLRPIHVAEKRNEKTPIYLVQPKTKTDYDGLIVAGVKKSLLYFRSFDPAETTRLPGPDAVAKVSESYGVICHFLPSEHVDANVHNIRSAFVAGLADGMERRSLFIQTGDTPVPIDLRDFVTMCRFPNEFKEAIGNLAERVYEDRSAIGALKPTGSESLLEIADLGASAAENEITSLGEYYLETDAFRRAKRREVRLVTGRKGSGKTAIFFMLRDIVRAQRRNGT